MIEIRVSGENAGEILEQLTGLVAGALPTDTSWTPDEYLAAKKAKQEITIAEKPKKKAEPNPMDSMADALAKQVGIDTPKVHRAKLAKKARESKHAINVAKKAAPEPKKETSKETKAPEKSEPAADAVDKATMQKKMKQLLDSGHRDELFAIFKEHGAKKLSEVDSSQYGVIYDQMEVVK